MHQWHYALDSGWPSRTTDQQRVMLSALLQRGADPTAACAINTAARFRNHRAILEFLDAVNATHGPDTPGARRVTQCLANTDHGNIFHQAANSPSPAIARLFFRGGKNSVNGTDDPSFALATEAGVQFGSAHWPTVTKAALEDATRPIELDLLLPFLPSRAGIHTQLIDASTGKPASSASAGRPQIDFSKIDPENLDDEQFEALLNELDPGHEEAESPAMKSAMEVGRVAAGVVEAHQWHENVCGRACTHWRCPFINSSSYFCTALYRFLQGIVKLTQDLKQLDKELQVRNKHCKLILTVVGYEAPGEASTMAPDGCCQQSGPLVILALM